MDELLTAKQVQEILNIDRTTVYRMLKDGRLSGVKISKHWRFLKDEIQSLLDLNKSTVTKLSSIPNNVIPIPCVQSLQDVFGEIADLGALTINADGQALTRPSNSCTFCNLIQSSEDGMKGCEQSWKMITKIKASNMDFFSCHAGLKYTYARIKVSNASDTFLIAGQFFTSEADKKKQLSRLPELASKYKLDLKSLDKEQKKISVLNDRIRGEINSWMARIARTIVSITTERSRLILRIKKISEISSMEF